MDRPAARQPFEITEAARSRRRLLVRDLVLDAKIGVHEHEREGAQPVRINIELSVPDDEPTEDKLENVPCYEDLVERVKTIVAAGHVNLVETLAERIAESCFADPRVGAARVRVEKLGAISEAAAVGVEIERVRG